MGKTIKKLSVTIGYDIRVMDCETPEDVMRDLRELRREGLDILSIRDKDERAKNVLKWITDKFSAGQAFAIVCYLNEVEFNEAAGGLEGKPFAVCLNDLGLGT